jgi:hypothetical protein
MSKVTTKDVRAFLETASEMFDETGCVPGIDGEEVRAETMVPDVKEYISESIDNPEVLCDSETWDRPGLRLSFRGWRKNGFRNATSSHLAAIRTLSSI